MMRLRSKLTYANVVATLALLLVVGGGGAFAASRLAKNSVGTKQIKNNSITAAKINSGAVTGTKVSLDSLGTVPSAAKAADATNAQNATHAENATVAGSIAPPEAPRLVGTDGQPPFAAQWENSGNKLAPVSFYKDREGVVHLEGLASQESNGGDLVFTLPSGYRPKERLLFQVFGYSGAPTDAFVDPDGTVHAGNETEVSLSGITFRAG